MGSPCELLIATTDEGLAGHLAQIVADEARRIERKFSRYLAGNIVAMVNSGDCVKVDEETANLIDFAETLYHLSERRFDITSGVLRRVWMFDGSDRLPSQDDVDTILEVVGWDKVTWDRPHLKLRSGMQIDLGGIGKEYAVDRAAGMLSGETDCRCLLNFGGDLVAIGASNGADAWKVGIEAVDRGEGSAEKMIRLKAGALATSGDTRRYLVKDGRRYGHILEPLTGWPVEDAPRSVTVAADTCTQAGMLATLAMLRGADAEEFLDEQDVRYWSFR